jgi:hypothetical protein
MDVLGFKLVTGDDIVARVSEETRSGFTIEKPVVPIPAIDPHTGQPTGAIQLHKWLPFTDESVYLDRERTIVVYSVDPEFAQYYLNATSDIQIPDNPSQILKG